MQAVCHDYYPWPYFTSFLQFIYVFILTFHRFPWLTYILHLAADVDYTAVSFTSIKSLSKDRRTIKNKILTNTSGFTNSPFTAERDPMHSKASKYSSGYMTVGTAILNNIALSIITFDYSLDASSGWWHQGSIGQSVDAALTSAAIMATAAWRADAPRASNCSGCHNQTNRSINWAFRPAEQSRTLNLRYASLHKSTGHDSGSFWLLKKCMTEWRNSAIMPRLGNWGDVTHHDDK